MTNIAFVATSTGTIPSIDLLPFIGMGFAFIGYVILLVIWSTVWKAFALWKSARRGEKTWFIIFLIINTAGILEIVYLLMNREPKKTVVINPLAPKSFTPPENNQAL